MRSALNNGQVDAIWVPEPFLSQGLNVDNARIVMAPGPVLGRYWPIGGYAARQSWKSRNPALAERFRKAINRSLIYAQTHPDEMRAMLPAGAQNSRLPIWSPVIDRRQAESARRLCAEVRRDHDAHRISGSSCRTASRAAWCSRAPSRPGVCSCATKDGR